MFCLSLIGLAKNRPKKTKKVGKHEVTEKDSSRRLRETGKNWIKLRFVFSFRGEKMVAMMEEYAEIDLIKTRRLQIEVMTNDDGIQIERNYPINRKKNS